MPKMDEKLPQFIDCFKNLLVRGYPAGTYWQSKKPDELEAIEAYALRAHILAGAALKRTKPGQPQGETAVDSDLEDDATDEGDE